MKTYSRYTTATTRGVAVEVVILVIALAGGAGFFGVREAKHAIAAAKAENTAKDLVKTTEQLTAANQAANDARALTAAARADVERARADVKLQQTELGRTIQRASTSGSIAVAKIPPSLARDLITENFASIDTASNKLFGSPETAELAEWKKKALAALESEAALKREVADQNAAIARLSGQLDQAEKDKKAAEDKVAAAEAKEKAAQSKADLAVGNTRVLSGRMLEATQKASDSSSLLFAFQLIVGGIAVIALLGFLLKAGTLAISPDTPLARVLNTAANTFHTMLAPMSVISETRAKNDTCNLIRSTGEFVTDLNNSLPAQKDQVVQLLDVALSPKHQRQIRRARIEAARATAADCAEVKLKGP